MKKKSYFLFVTFLFLCNVSVLWAQEEAAPVAEESSASLVPQTGYRITQISENAEGSLLAISDEGSVTVYDTSDYSPVCVLNDGRISKTAFYTEGDCEYFISMSSTGKFQVRKFEQDAGHWVDTLGEPYFYAECTDLERRRLITAVSFSPNADYIAAAFKDNTIQLHFRLRVTQSSISRQLKGHRSEVYGLEFSPSGEYLASVSNDGNAIIWNSYNGAKITSFNGVYARSKVPVVFSADSIYIIYQDGRNSFRIADFSGNTLYSIMTGRSITAIRPLKDPDLVAICNDKNEIMVYSISMHRPVSAVKVPEAGLSTFEFDSKADKMYAGFSNGAVNVYEPQPYLDDTEMLITDASLAGKGKGNFVHQRFQSLSLCAGANYLNKPYLASADVRAEYLYSEVISPFFVGGGLALSIGYPRKEFPVHYKIRGQAVEAPKLLSAVVYAPAGYAFSPWNNDFRVLTTFKAGAKMTSIALITNEGSIVGDPSFSFFTSLGAGMQIKWFMFDLNVEYDGVGKVSPSAYLGCVFRWGEE